MEIRLNKYIAENSEYSRRKADELIKEGKIRINGIHIVKLATMVNSDEDVVSVNGKALKKRGVSMNYIALNKPPRYICTRSDELGRKTVMELIPKGKNLKPVGRLDKDTEGLLLFSNDGEFINQLTHPKFECEKEYYAVVKGKFLLSSKNKLEKGIIIEDKKTSKSKIQIIKASTEETRLRITIHEGRKRQIRKMFDYTDNPVKYLQRIRIGSIRLGSLPIGKYRLLSKAEINANKPPHLLHRKKH
jgi:23S rRNA pseudouridine2605 synthase